MRFKRIQWLDFAKGFTIFFVIVAHWSSYFLNKTNGDFHNVIVLLSYVSFTFIMPMFFAISGYLYKKISSLHEYFLMIYKKGISLLIPYFLFSVVYIPQGLSHHQISNAWNIFLGYTYGNGFYLWFLLALFFIFITIGLLNLLHFNLVLQIIFISLLMLCQKDFWLPTNNTGVFSLFYITSSYAFFFLLGIIIKKFFKSHFLLNLNKLRFKASLSIYVVLWIILMILQYRITVPNYQTGLISVSDIITKVVIVLIMFLIFPEFNEHTKFFKYFTYYGRFTLVIYLVHMLILTILEHISHLSAFQNILPISFILSLGIAWILSIFCCYLSNKYTLINFIFYPRKYINKLIIKTKFGKWLLN